MNNSYLKQLKELSTNITSFNEFHNKLKILSTNEKGKLFEYFCKFFFLIEPISKHTYKDFYLFDELTAEMKEKFGLPNIDKGIDAIVTDINNIVHSVQIKYRKNRDKIVSFSDVATFQALTFGTKVKISKGIFFTNCYDVCDELNNDKYNIICFDTLINTCDKSFWKQFNNHIDNILNKTNKIIQYELRKPLKHQNIILEESKKYYENNNIGRLYLACGTGKTFLAYYLTTRILNCNKIIVIVPSLYLLSQTYASYTNELQYDDYTFLLVGSDLDVDLKDYNQQYKLTTNKDEIKKSLIGKNKIVVITTYQSSNLVVDVCKENKYKFDFGVYDEAHRTVGQKDKVFTKIVTSNIDKQKLFMTATEKIYNYCKNDGNEDILSMDDENIYGKVIYRYSMKQAIEDGILTDYKILAPIIASKEYADKINNNEYVDENDATYDIKVILIGIMIIQSIEKYGLKHMLIFSNTNERANQISKFINLYLTKSKSNLKNKLRCKFLSGEESMKKRRIEVEKFEEAEYGIISSCRIFGEGVDIKICDSICFADVKSSNVDIVQYVGRCIRKCDEIPNKLSHVLIPFVLEDEDDIFNETNSEYLKLRRVLKIIGTTDDMVTEKFKISTFKCIGANIENENAKEMICSTDIDTTELSNKIIMKVFDKSGIVDDVSRNALIYENIRRLRNNESLLYIKNDVINFLNDRKLIIPTNVVNWVKYCFGNKLYKQYRDKYVNNEIDFMTECMKFDIVDVENYKQKYLNSELLPPYEFLNNGFYSDMRNPINTNLINRNNFI